MMTENSGHRRYNVVLTVLLTLFMLSFMAGCAKREAHDFYEQGAKAMAEADYDSAVEFFKQAVDTGEFLAEDYRGLGLAHMCQSNYADACVALERARLYSDSQSADFVRDVDLYLAFCRMHHAETDKAMEIYTSMLKQAEDAEVYFLRGRVSMAQGDEEAAAADFDKAVSLSKDYSLYISIYQIYHDKHKDADGAAYLKAGLEAAEQAEDAYTGRALVYYYLQNYNEAKNQLLAGLAKDPTDKEALLLLGRVYLAMDAVADARSMFTSHLQDEAVASAAYNGLALCEIADGNYTAALAYIQKGLSLDDAETRRALLFNEIVANEYLHNWDTAREKCAYYMTLYPADENGLRENEFLSSR